MALEVSLSSLVLLIHFTFWFSYRSYQITVGRQIWCRKNHGNDPDEGSNEEIDFLIEQFSLGFFFSIETSDIRIEKPQSFHPFSISCYTWGINFYEHFLCIYFQYPVTMYFLCVVSLSRCVCVFLDLCRFLISVEMNFCRERANNNN